MRARGAVAGASRRAGLGVVLALTCACAQADGVTWIERFASAPLDLARWQRTLEGDTRTHAAEVVAGAAQGRLRLALDTRGTRDDTLKHVGIGSRCPLPLGDGASVRVRLDWGPPANGSYLAGALVLSPHMTQGDPTTTADFISVGYVGVPPGSNARLLVKARAGGVDRTLFTDGWPDANRAGRAVGEGQLEIAWRGAALEIREGRRLVYRGATAELPFDAAYVYLHVTSHSNFPERAVHFADLQWAVDGGAANTRPFPIAPRCGRD
jgi:hypothetical protein